MLTQTLKTLCLLALLSPALASNAQEIKIKKKVVFVDGAECLTVEKSSSNMWSFYTLEGKEVLLLKFPVNPKTGRQHSLVTFLDVNKEVRSQDYVFTRKVLLEKLVKDGILVNCNIDPTNIDRFVTKYHEQIDGY